jgi:hypothetical protein
MLRRLCEAAVQTSPALALRTAAGTVLRDRAWWLKSLVGGLLWSTLVGYPLAEGFQVEYIDNTRNGYAFPLPRWSDWSTKALYGFLAAVIDFGYFVLPILAAGAVMVCSALALPVLGGVGGLEALYTVLAVAVGAWMCLVWLLSLSPIAKRRFVADGNFGSTLSQAIWREALAPDARGVYLRARLLSAVTYLPAAALLAATWMAARVSFWPALVLLVLGLSALQAGRLVAIQLYDAAGREIERRRWEALRARSGRG